MANGEGLKLAFCLLLWVEQGGQVDSMGRPLSPSLAGLSPIALEDEDLEEGADIDPETTTHIPVRGTCTTPWDCSTCQLMQNELSRHNPDQINWICPACLDEVFKTAKHKGIKLFAPGHYSEGICTYKKCNRPSRPEEAEGLPGIRSERIIELSPGHSRLRQLIIGPVND